VGALQKLIGILARDTFKPVPISMKRISDNHRISSNYSRFVQPVKNAHQSRVEAAGKYHNIEYPPYPFRSWIPMINTDTDILDSIGFLNDASVGQGYYVTAEDQRIVDYITDFLEEIKADEIALNQGFENLAFGNSFWLEDPNSDSYYSWLQLGTIQYAFLGNTSNPVYYRSTYQEIPTQNLCHLTWRKSNASVFGYGLTYPLIIEQPYQTYNNDGTPQILVRPPITEMKKQIQHDALIRHHKTIGKTIYSVPDLDNSDKLDDLADKLNTPYTGVDHVVNYEVTAQELGANRRIMDADVKTMIDEEYIKASGNPETKLITAQGYTEASALASIKAASIRLQAFERYMSKTWQEVFIKKWYEKNPLADANGVPMPWKYAKVKMPWGSETHGEVDFASFVSLVSAAQSSGYRILTEKEIRNNLRNFDFELDADEQLGDLPTPPLSPEQEKNLEYTAEKIKLLHKLNKQAQIRLTRHEQQF
jgi:hypothetical protein